MRASHPRVASAAAAALVQANGTLHKAVAHELSVRPVVHWGVKTRNMLLTLTTPGAGDVYRVPYVSRAHGGAGTIPGTARAPGASTRATPHGVRAREVVMFIFVRCSLLCRSLLYSDSVRPGY